MNTFYKKAFRFFVGSSFAKILGLLLIPVVARSYSPSEFGVLAQVMAISLILIPLSNLRLPTIIPTLTNEVDVQRVFSLSVVSIGLVSVFTFIVAGIYYFYSGNTIYLGMAIIVMAGGLYELLYMTMVKFDKFSILSRMQIVQVCVDGVIKVSLAFSSLKSYGLVIAYMLFHIVSSTLLLWSIGKNRSLELINCKISRLHQTLKAHRGVPLYRMPSHLLMILSTQLPIIICSYAYDLTDVGYLSFALVILAVPASLVTQSIGSVYLAEISKVGGDNPKEIFRLTKDIVFKLSLLFFLPVGSLYLYSTNLFEFFFGIEWARSGRVAENLSIILIFQIVCAPIICVYTVFSMHYMFFIMNLLRAVSVFVVLFTGYVIKLDLFQMTYYYSLLMATYYIFLMLITWIILKEKAKVHR